MSTVNGFQVGSETLKYNYESLDNYNTPNFSTSSSKTYAVGDYVMYNGKLYKCTTATTGGTWVSGSWTLVVLSDDVSNLSRQISDVEDGIISTNVAWEHGTINQDTGEDTNPPSAARARTIGYITTDNVIKIDRTTVNYQVFICYYNSDKEFQFRTNGYRVDDITPNTDYAFYRLAILNYNAQTSAIDLDKVKSDFSFTRNAHFVDYFEDAKNIYVETVAFDKQTIFGRYTVGSINNESIKYERSTTRISTNPPVNATAKTYLITPSDGYKYILYTLTDPTHISPSYSTQAVWVTEERTYTIPDGINYLILVIAKTDNSTITTDDFDKVTVISTENLQNVADDIYSRFDKYPALLPEYWTTYLETKQQELTNADAALGFDGVSFAFVTDVHINTNNKLSPQLLKYITTHTNLREVVCGGDIITDYNTKANALKELEWWATNTSELKIVNLHGNHDGNSNNQTDNTQIITDAEYYGLECRQSENYVNFAENALYGYSDNERQKVRFIYLDTGAPDSAVINSTQLTWMQSKITELASGWAVVVFAHQFFNPASKTTAELTLDNNGTAILNTLNSIYDTANATIACVIVGHCHRDYSMYSDKGFPIIATTCDTSDTGASTYDPDQPTRTAGTTTEQVLDLYYISTNANAKTIKTIRIGAGDTVKNREFTY